MKKIKLNLHLCNTIVNTLAKYSYNEGAEYLIEHFYHPLTMDSTSLMHKRSMYEYFTRAIYCAYSPVNFIGVNAALFFGCCFTIYLINIY